MTLIPTQSSHAIPGTQRRIWTGLLCLAVGLCSSPLRAQQAKKPTKKKTPVVKAPTFIRIVRDEKTGEPLRMETATVRYVKRLRPAAGKKRRQTAVVDLIGAVHVGERSYYSSLNKQFEQYDALLYELVAPKGVRPAKGAGAASNNPAGFLQNAMKTTLGLDHQLELIDYSRKNFVHADLSPAEMAKAME